MTDNLAPSSSGSSTSSHTTTVTARTKPCDGSRLEYALANAVKELAEEARRAERIVAELEAESASLTAEKDALAVLIRKLHDAIWHEESHAEVIRRNMAQGQRDTKSAVEKLRRLRGRFPLLFVPCKEAVADVAANRAGLDGLISGFEDPGEHGRAERDAMLEQICCLKAEVEDVEAGRDAIVLALSDLEEKLDVQKERVDACEAAYNAILTFRDT